LYHSLLVCGRKRALGRRSNSRTRARRDTVRDDEGALGGKPPGAGQAMRSMN